MQQQHYKNGITGVILRVWLLDNTAAYRKGVTGLTNASVGLVVSTIADNEVAPTVYVGGSAEIDTIATLGTFATPAGGTCRFKEVNASRHPGLYEIQIANARWAVTNARSLVVTVSGVSGVAQTDVEIQLEPVPADALRINGGLLNGYNADLKLKSLDVQNSTGNALTLISTSNYGARVVGVQAAISVQATNGIGFEIIGTTYGLWSEGALFGASIRATNSSGGSGLELRGNGVGGGFVITAGATGVGFQVLGGSTSGDAVQFTAQGGNGNALALTKFGSGLALTAMPDVYHADIQYTRDQANSRDEYTVTWFKNGVRQTSGITSPTVQVIKRADGADLIAATAMTQIASTGSYKYDTTTSAARLAIGEAGLVVVSATIDGSARTWSELVTRDS